MADSVENKVVSITFDNSGFAKKLDDTLSQLSQLQKSFDFSSAKQSIGEVADATGKFNLNSMVDAVGGVSKTFVALSTIAITALSDIVRRAVDSGIAITKALTIDPVSAGLENYETQINAIQTILANTSQSGTNINDVNAALATLNTYANQTIYNFSEMTRNIGTFTAAGVDLQTSVDSIKGIANLAALSGSTSEQAATAMYQLSQAIAAGKVKLQDWNSVVNAGIGGKVFQKALFDTANKLGTISNAKVGETFDQWTAAGNSFRDSLQDGWLTSKVLTSTLSQFTGDMTDQQLAAEGFTQAEIVQIQTLAKTANGAATNIKTLTQLQQALKEEVATAWAAIFKTIFGNITDATTLFSKAHTVLENALTNPIYALNTLLEQTAALGGRDKLIDGLTNAVHAFSQITTIAKDAFRDIFPKQTADGLFKLIQEFDDFTARLTLNNDQATKLGSIFIGLFSIFGILKNVVVDVVKLFGGLLGGLAPVGSSIFDLTSNFGDFLGRLEDTLVQGGKIDDFFNNLGTVLQVPIGFLVDLKGAIGDVFKDGIPGAGAVGEIADRLSDRFANLRDLVGNVGDVFEGLVKRLEPVGAALEKVWDVISAWFKDLGKRLAAVLAPSDFNNAVDAVNVGLLGGILLALKKFLKEGLSLNVKGGFLDSIKESFEQLTGTLHAMQVQIKAEAIEKIAIAIGILTASVLVLSTINSKALTKSLTAMAVGFGQLMASFAVLNQISSGPKGAASLAIMSTGLIALSAAILVLTVAVKNLSDLNPKQLATGLAGIAGLLTEVTVAAIPLSKNSGGLVSAGVGMVAISAGLLILSQAVQSFAGMSWSELAKGMAAVAVGLGVITAAVNLMPPDMPAMGVGIIAIAAGMLILSKAVASFASLSWTDLAKGLGSMAVALLAIAAATQLMPPNLPAIGVGLDLVAVAILGLALGLKIIAGIKTDELVKSLLALAGALAVIAIVANAMTGTIGGAVALGVMAASLLLLATVLKVFASMSLKELGQGLLAIVGAMAALALAALILAPASAALLEFGLALTAVGIGFALFGVGAYLVAKAFEALADSGEAGAKALAGALKVIVAAIPGIVQAAAEGLVDLAESVIKAAPALVAGLGVVIEKLLETIIKLAPNIAAALVALVQNGLIAIQTLFPQIVQVGIFLIETLLEGIRDHIGEIVTVAAEIIVNFVQAIADNIGQIVSAAVNVIVAFVTAIGDNIQKIIDAGTSILDNLLIGIANDMLKVADTVTTIIVTFITALGSNVLKIVKAGGDMMINLITGIGNKATDVAKAGTDAALKFLGGLVDDSINFVNKAADLLVKFLNGMAEAVRTKGPEIQKAAGNLADALLDGIKGAIADGAKGVISAITGVFKDAYNGVKSLFGIHSPSKVFYELGEFMLAGFTNSMADDTTAAKSATDVAQQVVDSFTASLSQIPDALGSMDEFTPTITPVLDLSNVKDGAKGINSLLATNPVAAATSLQQANIISKATDTATEEPAPSTPPGPTEVSFTQINNSPKALSTSDIYKGTRSQFALAKEELNIP